MNDMVNRWKEPQLTFAPTPLKNGNTIEEESNKEVTTK